MRQLAGLLYGVASASAVALALAVLATPVHAYDKAAHDLWKAKKYDQAVAKLRTSADSGDDWSRAMLAQAYQYGYGVEKNYKTALTHYQQVDDDRLKWAYRQHGRILLYGWGGTPKDPLKARALFERAAKEDTPDSSPDALGLFELGQIYRKGWGVQKDDAKALGYYRRAEGMSDPGEEADYRSAAYIGLFHEKGEGVPQNGDGALKWYLRSAASGSNWAAYRIGKMFDEASVMPVNPAAAKKWYKIAAHKGSKWAKKVLKEKTFDDAGYLEAKTQWREQFPEYLKPFGIVLGKPFPHELRFSMKHFTTNTYGFEYFGLETPLGYPDPKAGIRTGFGEGFSARATNDQRVYEVRARLVFPSESHCGKSLSYYIDLVTKGHNPKAVRVDTRSTMPMESTIVADIGRGNAEPFIYAKAPLNFGRIENMNGVRIAYGCSGTIGYIYFLHLPTIERRAAEIVESVGILKHNYGGERARTEDRAEFVKQFGIALNAPLPKDTIVERTYEGNFENDYRIKPPVPSDVFRTYGAKTTQMTGSAIVVWAAGGQSSRNHCILAYERAVEAMFNKYNKDGRTFKDLAEVYSLGEHDVQETRFIEFYLSKDGFSNTAPKMHSVRDPDRGYIGSMDAMLARDIVRMKIGCLKRTSEEDYPELGAVKTSPWAIWMRAESAFWDELKMAEQCAAVISQQATCDRWHFGVRF